MIGARRGSPLVLGVGNGENFLASDVGAIVAYTRDAVYLNDFDLVAAGPDKFEISSLAGDITEHPVSKVDFTAEVLSLAWFPVHHLVRNVTGTVACHPWLGADFHCRSVFIAAWSKYGFPVDATTRMSVTFPCASNVNRKRPVPDCPGRDWPGGNDGAGA